MPLTVRTNGSGSINQIAAAWFNDYRDLLTGVMQDQEVTIKQVLALNTIGAAPSVALTATPASGGAMGVGVYVYTYTFVTTDGESVESPTTSMTTTSTNKTGALTAVAVGPTGTTGRNIYRTLVGGAQRKFLHLIADNTTTTYTDAAADGTLGANAPTSSSFGGSLLVRDASSTVQFRLNNDGSITPNGVITANGGVNVNTIRDNTNGNSAMDLSAGTGAVSFLKNVLLSQPVAATFAGSVTGTLNLYTPLWGPSLKVAVITMTNYQTASVQLCIFPSAITNAMFYVGLLNATMTVGFFSGGTSKNAVTTTTLGGSSAGVNSGSLANLHGDSLGQFSNTSIDRLSIGTNTAAVTSTIVIIGI